MRVPHRYTPPAGTRPRPPSIPEPERPRRRHRLESHSLTRLGRIAGSSPINSSRQACGRRPGWSGAQTGAQARVTGRARRAVRGGCLDEVEKLVTAPSRAPRDVHKHSPPSRSLPQALRPGQPCCVGPPTPRSASPATPPRPRRRPTRATTTSNIASEPGKPEKAVQRARGDGTFRHTGGTAGPTPKGRCPGGRSPHRPLAAESPLSGSNRRPPLYKSGALAS